MSLAAKFWTPFFRGGRWSGLFTSVKRWTSAPWPEFAPMTSGRWDASQTALWWLISQSMEVFEPGGYSSTCKVSTSVYGTRLSDMAIYKKRPSGDNSNSLALRYPLRLSIGRLCIRRPVFPSKTRIRSCPDELGVAKT